tara:strand:+ start:8736 stop:9587 length:852 start_codon:yes stop_codon:yes gene_type:complete
VSVRSLPDSDHLLDLMALRAVEGLNESDEAIVGAWDDPGVFDEAAATLAIGMTVSEGLEDLPASLRAKLVALADDLDAESEVPAPLPMTTIPPTSATNPPARRPIALFGALGWIAAAACLALAVIAWRPTPPAPSIEQQFALMENRPGVVRTAWLGLDDAGLSDAAHPADRGLSGEVVWDPTTNKGFMVFEGLASNDPTTLQYQLWIFDADRPTGQLPQYGDGILSQRPVDGGVFDVLADGRVIVPIDPKLPVGRAAIFAVTVEPPGGVVVSDRDIVTLAMVD